MNIKQINRTTALLLVIPFFLIFPSCKIDFDFGDIELAEDIEKEDSIAINTVIGPDSSIIKIWIDTENENITHSMADSDFKVQPIYELPEIQSSEVVADEQALENFKVKPAIRINVFPELPENAIGYQLQVNAENLKEQTKFVIRDMKASSKWVWIKNETSSSITFQNTFACCDTLEFSPEVIGETNGDAITIPANGTYAFDMLTEQLKVNQLELLLNNKATGKLLVSFGIPGNCSADVGCYNTYRVYTKCGSFEPKQIIPAVALQSMAKRATSDLKSPILKLTSIYLMHKKELQHLFKTNEIVQSATKQFLEDHKIAITNMFVSESYVLKDEQIEAAEELLYTIEEQTNNNELQQTIQKLKKELNQIENQTLKQALEQASLSIQ